MASAAITVVLVLHSRQAAAKARGANLGGTVRLSLALFLLALGAGPSSSVADPASDWSRVPQEIREQLHLSIKQIPPYPENDRRLMNVRSWPKARVFDGKEYVLEYEAWQWQSDVGPSLVRSLSEVDSGWMYGAHYVRYSQSQRHGSRRGPYYVWYPDSTLYQRAFFTTPSSWHSWYYDRQGNLRVYEVSVKGSGCAPGMSSTESFGTD